MIDEQLKCEECQGPAVPAYADCLGQITYLCDDCWQLREQRLAEPSSDLED
ncbi:MAG: hypothetical protein O2931_06270 [Planctomycetota bacterium]|nr:hypothetical protein [Planctomycetota bacterium]